MGTYNDALPITWGLQAVKAQEAWNLGAKGAGIKFCILDTGITYSHPEFRKADGTSVIKGSKNFVADGHADALEYAGNGSVTGPLVECSIADTTTSCPGMPATGPWIALINRGTIAFSNKIANVTTLI